MKDKAFVAIFVVYALLGMALLLGVIYVAVHFIGKYW